MWQSTISLRYVSYKNAGSDLHERICAMAMMAKNLLWSCAQIVVPRPPINPQRPNHAMERTADRCASTFEMTSTLSLRETRGLVRHRSSCSRSAPIPAPGRQHRYENMIQEEA